MHISIPLTLSLSLAAGASRPEAEPDAVSVAAHLHALDAARLVSEHEVEVSLPRTGRDFRRAKVRDTETQLLIDVAWDATGRAVDAEQVLRAEAAARRASLGKKTPVLAARLTEAAPDETIPVAIWLHADPISIALPARELPGASDAETRHEKEFRLAELRTTAEEAQREITSRLRMLGGEIRYASALAPLIYVDLPAAAVAEVESDESIDHLYDAWSDNADELDIQSCATNVDPGVWAYGLTGAGVVVAHVEDSRADRDNTCLVCDMGANKPTHINVDQHSTACTGMMVSSNITYKGIAHGACFYSANGGSYSDSDMAGAIDAGAANADLQSHSWGFTTNGQLNEHDRHIDYIVRNARVFADDSAGNSGNSNYLTSPGNGFNICTVANYDDRNTCDGVDDIMSSSSSGRDPISPNGDREKPEVAGPGTNITSLTLASPGTCPTSSVGSGTSYSAPVIGGIAAICMEADPGLKLWPEALKALLMASGVHNIEGDRRLSELDGTGGVDGTVAATSAVAGRWKGGVLEAADFSGGHLEKAIGHVSAGKRLKVVVCWDSNPNAGYTDDPLEADIDLDLIDPLGAVIASSSSYDNSYEVVDVDVTTAGIYRVRLSYRTWAGESEYVAGAWTISSP